MYGKDGSKGKRRRPSGRSEAGKPQPAWRMATAIAGWRSRRFRRKRSGKRLPDRRRAFRPMRASPRGPQDSHPGSGGIPLWGRRRVRDSALEGDDQANLRLARRPTSSSFPGGTRMIASLANRQATDGEAGAGMKRARHAYGDCCQNRRASAKSLMSELTASK